MLLAVLLSENKGKNYYRCYIKVLEIYMYDFLFLGLDTFHGLCNSLKESNCSNIFLDFLFIFSKGSRVLFIEQYKHIKLQIRLRTKKGENTFPRLALTSGQFITLELLFLPEHLKFMVLIYFPFLIRNSRMNLEAVNLLNSKVQGLIPKFLHGIAKLV